MDTQSSDIALGTNVEVGGAGDQGIMFGYATNETETYMPLPISMAHELVRYASELRHNGTFKHARPDMKSQVTIDYTDENNPKVDTILMSMLDSTIKDGVEQILVEEVPGVIEVQAI
mgnify:CR=1 FL=1